MMPISVLFGCIVLLSVFIACLALLTCRAIQAMLTPWQRRKMTTATTTIRPEAWRIYRSAPTNSSLVLLQ